MLFAFVFTPLASYGLLSGHNPLAFLSGPVSFLTGQGGLGISLGDQPLLLGRADDSTLVLTDDYASERHARLSRRGDDWYVEDLGSTNGTYLDRAKVTTAVRVPTNTPIRIGKTVIELRP